MLIDFNCSIISSVEVSNGFLSLLWSIFFNFTLLTFITLLCLLCSAIANRSYLVAFLKVQLRIWWGNWIALTNNKSYLRGSRVELGFSWRLSNQLKFFDLLSRAIIINIRASNTFKIYLLHLLLKSFSFIQLVRFHILCCREDLRSEIPWIFWRCFIPAVSPLWLFCLLQQPY